MSDGPTRDDPDPSPGSSDGGSAPESATAATPDGSGSGAESEPVPDDSGEDGGLADRVRTYLNYAVLAGLLLLSFVALIQFYLNAQNAIGTWVTPEYRSTFRALFNLVVLLVAGLGISYQLRRLTRGSGAGSGEGSVADES